MTAWLEEGERLRAELLLERAAAVARLAEIDSALSGLGHVNHEAPVARRVASLLAAAPQPLTVQAIRAALPGAGAGAVGSALDAMKKRGDVIATGRAGHRIYSAAAGRRP